MENASKHNVVIIYKNVPSVKEANLSVFGQKLRNARAQKGWSQVQLASEMGLKQASISQFENGSRQPTPALARKFAAVLDVPLVELVGEDGPGVLEQARLMRNLKGLSPNTLDTINTIIEAMRQKELPKRRGKSE